MTEPLISIIVPVYNVENYIRKCVDSIIGQTYKNLEIILVDDGSPDNCPAICDEYAETDSRIKVIHKKNGGLSDARNAGLDVCTGDYIAFVDSDDWIETEMYAEMLNMAEINGLEIVFCAAQEVINGEKAGTRYVYYPNGTVMNSKDIQKKVLTDEIEASVWNRLYKRECFINIRFPVGRNYEDIAVVFLPFEKAEKVGFLEAPLYYYRINESGIAHQRKPLTRYQMFLSYRECFNYAAEFVPESIEGAAANTARFAMGTYLDYHCYGWKELEPYLQDVEAFLEENKEALLNNKKMPAVQNLSLKMFYISRKVFVATYKCFVKLRGHR